MVGIPENGRCPYHDIAARQVLHDEVQVVLVLKHAMNCTDQPPGI